MDLPLSSLYAASESTRLSLPEDEAHIWLAWTGACDTPDLRAYYESLLTPEETARLRRFAFEYLRLEYLVTRALCRTVLSQYAAVAPQEWRFSVNAFGRPEVAGPATRMPIRFNLSNARSLVACIITHTLDAGIDVEETDRRGETLSIADHFFSAAELADLRRLPSERQKERFFDLWTLKESYIKARGLGLSIPLDQFSFTIREELIAIAFDPRLEDRPAEWQFSLLYPSARHVMAAGLHCGSQRKLTLRVREMVPSSKPVWKDIACAC